jgi:hypothetical protein
MGISNLQQWEGSTGALWRWRGRGSVRAAARPLSILGPTLLAVVLRSRFQRHISGEQMGKLSRCHIYRIKHLHGAEAVLRDGVLSTREEKEMAQAGAGRWSVECSRAEETVECIFLFQQAPHLIKEYNMGF